jgi:hypothetical protein
MATVHGQRAEMSNEEYADRRLAKARWKALQDRMDARAYREALALLEPDEPLLRDLAAADELADRWEH